MRLARDRHLRGAGPLALFLLANLLFLAAFADRDGYEGDDLNSIVPMAHLAAARQGALLIYRYAWQPLAYETGAALWRLFGTPAAVFLSAPVAGAATLAVLLALAWREAEGRLAVALVALLGVPELWYSSLYYNSTVAGLPFEAAALLLLRLRGGAWSAALAGAAMAVAILMRVDFVLAGPLLAMLAWPRGAGLARPAWLAAGVAAGLAAGWAAGLVDLPELARIQAASGAEIRAKADMPGWDLRTKLLVLSVTLSPVGWALLLGGALPVVAAGLRRDLWRQLLWLVAALPACLLLPSLLSPKYMLPIIAPLPMLFVHAQDRLAALARDGRPVRAALLLLAVVPVFVSVSPSRHPPFARPGLRPVRPVGSHDGPRGFGGYLWQMTATDEPAAQTPDQHAAAALAAAFARPDGPDLVILGGENVFDPGGVGWRHLQLRLERAGLHGQLVGPHLLRFGQGRRRLLLARSLPPALRPGTRVIDLRSPSDEQP